MRNHVPFGSICTLQNGRAFKSSEWSDQGTPIIRIQNLNNESKPFNYCNFEVEARFQVNSGDLLFSWSGTPGTSFGAFFWNRGKGFLNQHIFRVDVDEKATDKDYLRHAINSKLSMIIEQAHGGVGLKHITKGKLEAIEIYYPDLPTQKHIAAILNKADAIRRKRLQAIDLADQFLQSVYLNMFETSTTDATNKAQLGNLVAIDAPMVDPRDEQYLDMLHIGSDRIEKGTGKLLEAITAREEGLISKKFLFDENYVLYSKIRPYLKKCALAQGTGLCSADMYPIRPLEGKITREFLWRLLLSDEFTRYTESLPTRANIPKLNRKELEAFEFVNPDYEKQQQFSEIVRALNSSLVKFESSANLADQAFSALSQRAFSGELQLSA
ncbi:MAG: restriction endonuclease subunit S [Gammaproteobacteria bacterium]